VPENGVRGRRKGCVRKRSVCTITKKAGGGMQVRGEDEAGGGMAGGNGSG